MSCSSCKTKNNNPKGCKNNGVCGTDGCNKLNVFNWLSNLNPISNETTNYYEVRFKNGRKNFYFNDDDNLNINIGDAVVKNKVAPPFRVCEFDIMYGEGISKIGEILDIGTQAEIIDKSGSWFSYGETKLGQGRDSVKNLLKDNPELCDELEKKISEVLNSKNS